MSESNQKKVSDLTFEEALEELQSIVKNTEMGKYCLDETLKQCERGNELRMHCEKKLQEAKLRVEKLNVGNGNSA